jgi:hypothetical protein
MGHGRARGGQFGANSWSAGPPRSPSYSCNCPCASVNVIAYGARGMILSDIFDESYYADLDGGILESFGRFFKNNLKLFIYPYLARQPQQLITIDTLEVAHNLRQLFGYLVDRRYIVQLTDINHDYLKIYSPDVLKKIGADDHKWESMVPPRVAEAIKARGLFGYG